MATKKRKQKKPQLLSHTRPTFHTKSPSLSSRATRDLIRTHHTLQKQLTQALAAKDVFLAASVQRQMDSTGGLQQYQRASIQGQSTDRGGDSSKVLMEWLNQHLDTFYGIEGSSKRKKPRLLEVGALRVDNVCAKSGRFDVERIDLHSQHLGIKEQDFMERPIPEPKNINSDGFDVVSLSLVVNYVGDNVEKGEMLKRVGSFLKREEAGAKIGGMVPDTGDEKLSEPQEGYQTEVIGEMLPGLFLVLPLSCVTNSRYMNEARLSEIMESLGYKLLRCKLSNKLIYQYWKFQGCEAIESRSFGKEEVRKGGGRNNFAIVLH